MISRNFCHLVHFRHFLFLLWLYVLRSTSLASSTVDSLAVLRLTTSGRLKIYFTKKNVFWYCLKCLKLLAFTARCLEQFWLMSQTGRISKQMSDATCVPSRNPLLFNGKAHFNKIIVSIDIHQSKWKTSSITAILMKQTLSIKTWFVAKYDSIKNNKIHEAS